MKKFKFFKKEEFKKLPKNKKKKKNKLYLKGKKKRTHRLIPSPLLQKWCGVDLQ